jgi:hypothetical protein
MPKRSQKMFSLSEKVKIVNLIRKEKLHREAAKFYSKYETSICESVKKEKDIRNSFADASQTAFIASVGDKCLVRIEKGLNL